MDLVHKPGSYEFVKFLSYTLKDRDIHEILVWFAGIRARVGSVDRISPGSISIILNTVSNDHSGGPFMNREAAPTAILCAKPRV